MNKFVLYTGLIVGLSSLSHAMDKDRGGGNAVVCFSDVNIVRDIYKNNNRAIKDSELNQITSIELLDLYEERLRTDIDGTPKKLLEPHAGETPKQFARRLIERVKRAEVDYHEELVRTMEKLFDQDNLQMAPYGIDQYKDVVYYPPMDIQHCVLATMAKVTDGGKDKDDHFLIDSRLFHHRLHSDQSKGALILHETIYRHMRESSKNRGSVKASVLNSDSSRKIVGMLFREKLTAGYFVKEIQKSMDYSRDGMRRVMESLYYTLRMGSLLPQAQINTCAWHTHGNRDFPRQPWHEWETDPHYKQPCTPEDKENILAQVLEYFDTTVTARILDDLTIKETLTESQVNKIIKMARDKIASNKSGKGEDVLKTITRGDYLEREWPKKYYRYPFGYPSEDYLQGIVFEWQEPTESLLSDAEIDQVYTLDSIWM